MSPNNLSSLPNHQDIPAPVDQPFRAVESDLRGHVPFNNLSRHMKYLRRRHRAHGPWHILAILCGALLALGMAGYLSR
ncbi:MAG TPA: hypothetical protein VMJ93_06450 [Verrucomicrobiae bacterium]|nr:hypothetical protein [Verrucomicrobiae bacterium]